MNLASPLRAASKLSFRVAMKCRSFLPKTTSQAFGKSSTKARPRIERIRVINLDRQPARLAQMENVLRQVLDSTGNELWNLTARYAAVDAVQFVQEPQRDADIDPIYTLGDQLSVEPQPMVLPNRLQLDSPIHMSRPEIAVARSHIDVWRQVAESSQHYVLVLEDDVWFRSGFASQLDQAWSEIQFEGDSNTSFDILYLSYEEVKYGAPKISLSRNVFRPIRGLWHLSGYVLSRDGAHKLLGLLPCRGPIDLWINHHFGILDVRALRRSIINQRRDIASTNSYSILPSLTRIGAVTSESASLFHARPSEGPVFAFGPERSGLSSLAMALSMLGYRCSSDLHTIPPLECEMLLSGKRGRVFDAYVNIGSLAKEGRALRVRYPRAKFIVTSSEAETSDENTLNIRSDLNGADIAVLHLESSNKWKVVCEHLKCAPPTSSFPELPDLGQRRLLCGITEPNTGMSCRTPKRDKSPWVVEPRRRWRGIDVAPMERTSVTSGSTVAVTDHFETPDSRRWLARDDTFTDNLALFRPSNIEYHAGLGAALSVKWESVGVREYTAASLTTRDQFLFGRFEATLKAVNVPGVVTGFFLHRNSPRQEIDIELAGNRPDRLLVNVFYNPGSEGARFDYGYRGAASHIDLGFDASEAYHRFAIEWRPCEIRWFVDGRLVHRRCEWEPTPIPHLPMALHVNAWPSRSRELAGRLAHPRLPTSAFVRSIELEANRHQRVASHEDSFL